MQAATQRSKRLCRNPSCAPQNTRYVHKHPTCSPSYLAGGTRNPAGNNAVLPMKSTLLCTHCLCPPPPSARDNKRRRHSKTSGQPSGFAADGSLQPPRQLTGLGRSSESKVRLNWTFIPSPNPIVLRPESNQENPGPTRDPF